LVDIDHIGRFTQKKNRSTVDIDRRSGHTLKKTPKSVDIEFAYPYFKMSTDENNCLSHSLLITLNNFKRISLNNTHTHRDHDGHGQELKVSWGFVGVGDVKDLKPFKNKMPC